MDASPLTPTPAGTMPPEPTDEELYYNDSTWTFVNADDELYLELRYYARNIIPAFCAVGMVGNCMALMLMRSNYWLRRLTSNVYLCTLSMCSCLFLFTVLVTWADTQFGVPLYSDSPFGCKALTFLAHACDFICVWMISWVSCDRAIVLFRPGIRKRICSKAFARNLVAGTILASVTLYGWCLVFAGLERGPAGTSYCGINSDVKIGNYELQELHIFFSLLDTIICTIVPSVLIMMVNSLSIYRYHQCMKVYSKGVLRVRFLKEMDYRYYQEAKETCPEETSTDKKLLSQSQITNQMSSQSSRVSRNGRLKTSELTLSRSLLIVTSTFVILNVPNYAFRLYSAVFNVDPSPLFSFSLFMTYLLYYLHHAVLFYMYIFWSPQMKKQFVPTALKLLECYCIKNVPDLGHHSQYSKK